MWEGSGNAQGDGNHRTLSLGGSVSPFSQTISQGGRPPPFLLLNNAKCPMIARQILISFVEMPILIGTWICNIILSFYFYMGRVPALFLPSDE